MNPRPLTHEERLELIHRPFFINYIGRSYPWAGTILGNRFPEGKSGFGLLVDPYDREEILNGPITYDGIPLTDTGRRLGRGPNHERWQEDMA